MKLSLMRILSRCGGSTPAEPQEQIKVWTWTGSVPLFRSGSRTVPPGCELFPSWFSSLRRFGSGAAPLKALVRLRQSARAPSRAPMF